MKNHRPDAVDIGGWSFVIVAVIILILALFSCEKSECYTFEIQTHRIVICDQDTIRDEVICSYTKTICGITQKEAENFARVNSIPSEDNDYIVAGCLVCENIRILEIKKTRLIY